ncbi:gliding motility lipoprotein GldB [Flavobacterium sp. U410]
MKKLFVFSLFLLLFSCKEESKVDQEVAVIPVEFKIERFDQIFYQSKPEDLAKIKAQYPFFFPPGNEDTVWTNKLSDPLLKELYAEVQKKYADLGEVNEELKDFFARVQYYYPKYKTPRVITLISEVDTDAKAVYADTLALVSLDCYLGANHRFYVDFPEYQRVRFNEDQILPDLAFSFAQQKVPVPSDRTLLSSMIYFGKLYYMEDALLPKVADEAKIGYTKEQVAWCKENEAQMWSYFIENNLLFDTNQKNEFRFISEAPFSKFYLDIDNESPGRTGQWIGWQIVRSYMGNNNVSLQDMLAMDAKTIFERSKYKPAK